MKIAILGSWRQRDPRFPVKKTLEEFQAACYEIGRELATQRQTIVVGGHSRDTADINVVKGFIDIIGDQGNHPLIHVIRPDDDKAGSYDSLAASYPKLFSFPPSLQQRWGEVHLVQIRYADRVLVIGGSSGTYQAGLAAIAGRRTLIPIGAFGGASAQLSNALYLLNSPDSSQLALLNGPWSRHMPGTLRELLGIGRKPSILIIHGRATDRYMLSEFLRSTLGLSDLLIMQQEFGGGRTLPEKFESMAAKADGAIALATPDDLGGLAGDDQRLLRARQNLWVEVGWVWGRLGRDRLILLDRGPVEIPSDLQGLERYTFKDSPNEVSESIRAFVTQLNSSTS